MNNDLIRQCVRESMPWLIQTRRALHRIPETGFDLPETRAYIARVLTMCDIPFQEDARGWITATIAGANRGEVIGLRADMDALPISEAGEAEFASVHAGKMHACGHDAHMACLLGAAKLLAPMRKSMSGTVRLLFQPAEETVGGARPMVEAGVLNDPDIEHVFGLHVEPEMPVGTVCTRVGTLYASTDDLDITLRGVSAHGASPARGADAIVCAAQLVTAIQSVLSRNIDPTAPAVVHIGSLHGGSAQNIVCDAVRLWGTIRTIDEATNAIVKRRLTELSENIARAYGCTAQVSLTRNYPMLVNSREETQSVVEAATALFGKENVLHKEQPTMCGEDFAFFADRVPGAYFLIGASDPDATDAPGLHNPDFTINEEALFVGCAMHMALAQKYLRL